MSETLKNQAIYLTKVQNAILKAVIKMSENTDVPENHNIRSYAPTIEVTRQINEINRMMEKTDMSFSVISNKILECASAKFTISVDYMNRVDFLWITCSNNMLQLGKSFGINFNKIILVKIVLQ
jgi:hypothetical protein